MAESWNIRGRSDACSACGTTFEPGSICHSRLVRGDERFERVDLCDGCTRAESPEGGAPVSRWRSIVVTPPPPPPEPIQRRNAESLLRKLVDDPTPEAANTRFILAVMLERKRIVRCRDEFRQDEQRVFVYEHPRTGETFLVPDPGLTPRHAAAVREELGAFLQEDDGADGPPSDPGQDDQATLASTGSPEGMEDHDGGHL
jgi:hypothetical protein